MSRGTQLARDAMNENIRVTENFEANNLYQAILGLADSLEAIEKEIQQLRKEVQKA